MIQPLKSEKKGLMVVKGRKDENRWLSDNIDETSIVMYIHHGVPYSWRQKVVCSSIWSGISAGGGHHGFFGSVQSQPLEI